MHEKKDNNEKDSLHISHSTWKVLWIVGCTTAEMNIVSPRNMCAKVFLVQNINGKVFHSFYIVYMCVYVTKVSPLSLATQ